MTTTIEQAPVTKKAKQNKATKTAKRSIPRLTKAIGANPADAAPHQSAPPRVSKLDQLVALLQRETGASIPELVAGSLKRKGHEVTSERIDGIRRYRIKPKTMNAITMIAMTTKAKTTEHQS